MASSAASSSPAISDGTSTSVITAAKVTGSHVPIDGYSATRGLGVGRYVSSSKFMAAGHPWFVRYYPDGCNQESADCISLAIIFGGSRSLRVAFRISLLDPEDGQVQVQVQVHAKRTYQPVWLHHGSKPGWGFPHFIQREDFEKSKYLRDNCFGIVCDITVYEEASEKLVGAVPPSDLHLDLGWMLATGNGADMKFKVGDKLFSAHKSLVAARSSVFRAELFGPLKGEAVRDVVEVYDMEPEVFMTMLHFMYTDSVPKMRMGEEVAMAQHLLVAADRYDLKRLKLICEDKLCSLVTKKTAVITLVLAEQHGCHGLKKACFAFLSSLGSLKEVMGCDGYGHLRTSCPSLHDELVAKFNVSNFKGNKVRSFWCFSS